MADMNLGTLLRQKVGQKRGMLVPGAANALAARVIEGLGFEAIYLSGAGLTNTFYGLPDLGFIHLGDLAQNTAAIREAVKLPIIVDADTGFGNALNVRQTVRTSGIHGIALTKLDILDGFEEIKICVRYTLDGVELDHLPASQDAQARVVPVYETIEGWKGTTAHARSWVDLPAQAIKYVRRIEELIGAPVAVLSTSPERDDTILVQNPFEA